MNQEAITQPEVRIEPAAAAALVDAGQAIVVDVVGANAWGRLDRAIHGAIRIPPDEFDRRWRELPRERTIIAYCT
jgi:rhodanese-related sulfurtransferase